MAASKKPRTHTLSIFLLKEEVKSVADCLGTERKLEAQSFSLSNGTEVELHTRRTYSKRPRWARYFDGSGARLPDLSTASASGLLFITTSQRLFALAFGAGRHDLKPGTWEESFGLKVTVNSIDEKKIRSIDHKTFEAIALHTKTQTSHAVEAFDFGLDIERDMLRAITGTPKNERLGVRLAGLDSLTATVACELDDLPGLLDAYFERFESKDYLTHFEWIDRVREIRDKSKIATLNEELETALRSWSEGSTTRLWLVPPDLVRWELVGGFTYGAKLTDSATDLHIRDLVASESNQASISVEALKKKPIFLRDLNDEILDRWTAFSCLYGEFDIGADTYLLTAGKWYQVERNFAKSVKKEISQLISATHQLPYYKHKSEAEYNEYVAQNGYHAMDKKTVMMGGGRSRFEACDLLSSEKHMIHVKRYGGSAPLSHLFAQGAAAAELWMSHDPEFRKRAKAHLPPAYGPFDPLKRPDADEYCTVFAVVCLSKKPIDQVLPFFSCLSLKNAARHIRSLGMRVELTKIQAVAA